MKISAGVPVANSWLLTNLVGQISVRWNRKKDPLQDPGAIRYSVGVVLELSAALGNHGESTEFLQILHTGLGCIGDGQLYPKEYRDKSVQRGLHTKKRGVKSTEIVNKIRSTQGSRSPLKYWCPNIQVEILDNNNLDLKFETRLISLSAIAIDCIDRWKGGTAPDCSKKEEQQERRTTNVERVHRDIEFWILSQVRVKL